MKTIVTFHIGRGGRFHNPGFKTYEGELNLQDIIRRHSDNLYDVNRKDGKFCKPYLADCSGHNVCDTPKAEVGTLEFDGEYNTYICRYIEDCTEDELELIAKDNSYKSPELQEYMKANYIDYENFNED